MPKYLKIEAPHFNTDGKTPMTSYLRIGSIEDASAAASPDVPVGDPSGEDLARQITSFSDDDRQRCADGVDPEPAQTPKSLEQELSLLKAQQQMEQARHDFLVKQLEALDDNPGGWLSDFVTQVEAAAELLPELEREIMAESERLQAERQQEIEEKTPPDVGPPDYCDGYLAPSARKAVTEKLHTRGGWRDHTDGNRISTTRGDKVEVVGGNYRLVVLGREPGPVNPAGQTTLSGWDISGGHVGSSSITSGDLGSSVLPDGTVSESKIEWCRNWDGTWRTKTTEIKGDTDTTTVGDTISYSYGKTEESITGSEKPTEIYPNPIVVDRSWNELNESYTGSKAAPVPLQYEETWADKVSSKTYVTTMIDTTKARTMTSKTTAEVMNDETVAETMTSITVANSTSDTTICGTQTSTTMGDTDSTTIGNTSDLFIGAKSEVTVGNSESYSISASADITMAIRSTITIGATADLTVGAAANITMGPKVEATLAMKSEKEAGFKTELSIVRGEMALSTTWS